MNSTNASVVSWRSSSRVLRDVLTLFKLRIATLIAATAAAGYMLSAGAAADGWRLLLLTVGTLLAAASSGAFNHYHEAISDRRMQRTADRPFASGRLRRHPLWLLLFATQLAISLWLVNHAAGLASASFVFLGAFCYGVVYTVWLKRRSAWNIVIGGLSGSFALLAGSAVQGGNGLDGMAWSFALILCLWTPPHFWSLAIAQREEYERAGIPMLPVVLGNARAARVVFHSTLALTAACLLPMYFGASLIYAVPALAVSALFLQRAWQLQQAPSRQSAIRSFLASLLHLAVVLCAAGIDAWWQSP
jgi:protoheme IX farnesyltransferase